MLECIVDTVVDALVDANIQAVESFGSSPLDRRSGPVVCVGLQETKWQDAGFAQYLGLHRADDGSERETYAMRCDVVLSLSVYAPMNSDNAARACTVCFDSAVEVLRSLGGGLRLCRFSSSAAVPDTKTDMFHCSGTAEGSAFLTAERNDDGTEFTDFVLKGVIRR